LENNEKVSLIICINRKFMPLLDHDLKFPMLQRIKEVDRHIYDELALKIPTIYFQDNQELEENSYSIKINKSVISSGKIYPGRLLAVGPEILKNKLEGIEYSEPAYNMFGLWIRAELLPDAEKLGCLVLDPVSVLSIHLTEIIRKNAADLLGEKEVEGIIDMVRKSHPALVKEVYPDFLSISDITAVLQRLLNEGISIKYLIQILETLADNAPFTKDYEELTEYVRIALSEEI